MCLTSWLISTPGSRRPPPAERGTGLWPVTGTRRWRWDHSYTHRPEAGATGHYHPDMPNTRRAVLHGYLVIVATAVLAGSAALAQPDPASADQSADAPFVITIVDEATNRGIPLVKLTTTSNIALYTDSAGVIAFDEPGLMDRKVWFTIESPGYEYPADGFGSRGRALVTRRGDSVTIPLKRTQIAERLYRITGQGIYHHSTRAGLNVPLGEGSANLNGRVTGQDSVIALPHGGKLYWFWGDTGRPDYPLGNFATSCATSPLPGEPGCDPATGIELTYLVNDDGFSRPVFDLDRPGVVWMGGAVELPAPNGGSDGSPRIIAAWSRLKGLGELLEHGIAAFDDQTQMMEVVATFPLDAPLIPSGHTVRHTDDGVEYVYFTSPYALVRVPATWEAFIDPDQYEGFTPLVPGTRTLNLEAPQIERDAEGRPVYGWKKKTAVLSPQDQQKLIDAGHLAAEQARYRTNDAGTGEPILLHGGTIRYNERRNAWVMIATRIFDEASLLGEVYYAEAPTIHGPWPRAVKVATHPKYSFYNPVHHEFFDADGGRVIYFEGTYTMMFSGTTVPTPRYEYNQLMYRLDLSDERITSVFD